MIVEHNQSTTYSGGQYENAYKFNGKELDDATQMYYYGARYYDPRISIFVSVDPLAEEFVGWTPYHYVHQNPINLIDPTGMSAEGLDHDPPEGQNPRKSEGRPEGMSEREALSHIVEVDGKKYHKYTGNVFAKVGNAINSWFGGDDDFFVEKKPYNKADDNFIHEAFDTAAGGLVLGKVFGIGGRLLGKTNVNSVVDKATDMLMEQASNALKTLGKGSGAAYGTKAHSIFSKSINGMQIGNYTIKSEVSYLNGQIVKHGTKGSARIDAGLYNSKNELIHVFDLKTGGARLTTKQVQHIQGQVGRPVGVSELKVQ